MAMLKFLVHTELNGPNTEHYIDSHFSCGSKTQAYHNHDTVTSCVQVCDKTDQAVSVVQTQQTIKK